MESVSMRVSPLSAPLRLAGEECGAVARVKPNPFSHNQFRYEVAVRKGFVGSRTDFTRWEQDPDTYVRVTKKMAAPKTLWQRYYEDPLRPLERIESITSPIFTAEQREFLLDNARLYRSLPVKKREPRDWVLESWYIGFCFFLVVFSLLAVLIASL